MCKFHLEGETNQQNEETTTEAAGDGFILVLITLGEPFSTSMQIIYGHCGDTIGFGWPLNYDFFQGCSLQTSLFV